MAKKNEKVFDVDTKKATKASSTGSRAGGHQSPHDIIHEQFAKDFTWGRGYENWFSAITFGVFCSATILLVVTVAWHIAFPEWGWAKEKDLLFKLNDSGVWWGGFALLGITAPTLWLIAGNFRYRRGHSESNVVEWLERMLRKRASGNTDV